MKNKLLFLTLIVCQLSFSQNIPPEISYDGNEFYCPLSFQSIVTDFDIVDPDDTSIDGCLFKFQKVLYKEKIY